VTETRVDYPSLHTKKAAEIDLVIWMSYFAVMATASSVLLVGEDDAFDMYAELLRVHDFSTTVMHSPDAAIEQLAQVQHPRSWSRISCLDGYPPRMRLYCCPAATPRQS
jgi:hypothetical protein